MKNKSKPVKRAYKKRATKPTDTEIKQHPEALLLGILLSNFNALDQKGQDETLKYIVGKVAPK